MIVRRGVPWANAALLMCLAVAPVAGAVPPASLSTPPAPSSPVATITLANGFRALLVPKADEKGRLCLRLVVNVGALDEREEERGFAHLAEHMAFNGTKHYPPGTLLPVLQRLGIGFGPDANAETLLSTTTYKLDLPAGSESSYGEAFQVFADFAAGIVFDRREVRRERDVVLSELAARDTDQRQVRLKLAAVLYDGTEIGTVLGRSEAERVRHAEAGPLEAFYRRCYRPERMTLVVVGDITAEKLAPFLAAFGAIPGHSPSVPLLRPVAANVGNGLVHTVVDPLATAATASLITVLPGWPQTEEGDAAQLVEQVLLHILQQRMRQRQAGASTAIGMAVAFRNDGVDARYGHYVLQATSARDNWTAAVALVESELRRAQEGEYGEVEIRSAVDAVLYRTRLGDIVGRGAPLDGMANELARLLVSGRQWESSVKRTVLAERMLPKLAGEELRAMAQRLWPASAMRLVLTTAQPLAGGVEAVRSAFEASRKSVLPVAEVRSVARFQYHDFGPPGEVARRTSEQGIELVRFVNGVRLNVRTSKVDPYGFRLGVRLGRGAFDVPPDRPGIGVLAAALFSRVDFGRHTRDELRTLMSDRGVEAEVQYTEDGLVLMFTGGSEAVGFALRCVTACVGDLKLAAGKWREGQSWYPALVRSMLSSTEGFTRVESIFQAAAEDARLRLPPLSQVQAYTFDEVAAWIRSAWLDGPIEIGVIGDFTAADVVSLAAATVGTLPPRAEAKEPVRWFAPRSAVRRKLDAVELPDRNASVRCFWFVPDFEELRVRRIAAVATAGLQEHLWRRLRQERGATYSPSRCAFWLRAQPAFAFVGVDLSFAPDKAKVLAEETIKLADDFGAHGLTATEVDQICRPLRAQAAADLRSNAWWLQQVLLWAQSDPLALEEARTHASAFDDLAPDEVNRFSAARFRRDRANCVGFIPRPPKAATGR